MRFFVVFFLVLLCLTLYHQSDGLKCYICNGDCNDPKETECAPSTSDWLCIATSLTSDGKIVEAKSCGLNDQETKAACNAMDETDEGSCYTCDTDLCNGNKQPGGARKCYSCLGDCQPPYSVEECSESNDVTHVCRTSQITINNVIYARRGCAADIEDVNDICNNIEKSDVGSCYTCPDDLCNDFLYTRVTQCYNCYGYCNSLSVETCPDDGQNYMCMTFKNDTGNTTVQRRGCYLAYGDIMDGCTKSNDLKNGSCYTCFTDLCNAA